MNWELLSNDRIEKNVEKDIENLIKLIDSNKISDPRTDILRINREALDKKLVLRKLYVASLPFDITEEKLREFFSSVGNVESVSIKKDDYSGKSKGFGFVVMSSGSEAQDAIKNLSGETLGGRKVFVKQYVPRANKYEMIAESIKILADLSLKDNNYHKALELSHNAFERYHLLGRWQDQKYKKSMIESVFIYIQAFLRIADVQINKYIERAEKEVKSILKQAYNFQGIIPREADVKAKLCLFDFFDEQRKKLKQEDPTSITDFLTCNFRKIWEMDINAREKKKEEWLQDAKDYCPNILDIALNRDAIHSLNKPVLMEIERLGKNKNYAKIVELLRPLAEQGKQILISPLEKELAFKWPGKPPGTKQVTVKPQCEIAYAQYKKRNYEGAIKSFDEVLNRDPMNSTVLEWRGYLNARSEHYSEAERDLGILERRKMGSNVIKWNLMCVHYKQKKYQRAFRELSGIKSPESKRLLQGLAIHAGESEYIISDIISELDLRILGLGFVMAYDKVNLPQAESYLSKIISLGQRLIDDFQPFPENEPLDEEDVARTLSYFTRYELFEEGIRHFSARISNRQKGWHIYKAFGCLCELAGKINDAYDCYSNFFKTIIGIAGLKYLKYVALRELLDLCVRHDKLHEEGKTLLADYGYLISEEELSDISESISKHEKKSILEDKNGEIKIEVEEKQKDESEIEADAKINYLNSRLADLTTPGQVKGRKEKLTEYCSNIRIVYNSQIGGEIASSTEQIIELLCAYADRKQDEGSINLINEADSIYYKLIEKVRSLGQEAEIKLQLIKRLGTCIGQAQRRLETAPEPKIKILNPSLAPDLVPTSLVIEILNPSEHYIENLLLELKFEAGIFESLGSEKVQLRSIPPQESEVVKFPILRVKENNEESFCLTYKFRSREKEHASKLLKFKIPTKAFNDIPSRYIHGRELFLSDHLNFHGREDDIQNFLKFLPPLGQGRFIFLDGLRRVGKTSLINFLLPLLPENLAPVNITTDEISTKSGTSDFLYEICERIARVLSDDKDVKPPSTKSEFDQNPAKAFKDCLENFNELYPDRKILLILDEFQDIVKSIRDYEEEGKPGLDETPLNLLRANVTSGKIHLLCTGSIRYRLLGKYFKHRLFTALNKRYPLSFLSESATKDVLQKPVEQDGVIFSEKAKERVWKLTQGYSEFIQKIADLSIEILNREKRLVVAQQDIDEVVDSFVKEDVNFQWWWDDKYLKESEEQVMQRFLELQESPGQGVILDTLRKEFSFLGGEFDSAINNLLEQQILTRKNENYIIKAELLERWLVSWLERRKSTLATSLNYCVLGIDHENLVKTLTEKYKTKTGKNILPETTLENAIKEIVSECETFGTIVDYLSVACFQYSIYHKDELVYYRVNPKFRCERPIITGKDVSDDVIRREVKKKLEEELLAKRATINTVIIVSGDGYFISTLIDLRREGRRVLIRGFDSNTNRELKKEAGRDFTPLENIIKTDKLLNRVR